MARSAASNAARVQGSAGNHANHRAGSRICSAGTLAEHEIATVLRLLASFISDFFLFTPHDAAQRRFLSAAR